MIQQIISDSPWHPAYFFSCPTWQVKKDQRVVAMLGTWEVWTKGARWSQGCDIFTEVEGNPTSFGEPLVCEPSRPPEAGQGLEGEVACPSAWYTEISRVGVTWNFLRDRETKGLYHTGNLDLHGKPFRLVKADYQFYQHWFDAAMCEKLF